MSRSAAKPPSVHHRYSLSGSGASIGGPNPPTGAGTGLRTGSTGDRALFMLVRVLRIFLLAGCEDAFSGNVKSEILTVSSVFRDVHRDIGLVRKVNQFESG